MTSLADIQRHVGVPADGVIGPQTIKAIAAALGIKDPVVAGLTTRTLNYIASEEGLCQEAYKDSVGVWTWALGVTNASGHIVHPRYKDDPQPIERCIEVSVWLMQKTYLPPVLKAFDGYPLAEHQLAAALSWQWNTGAILTTEWVKLVKAGKRTEARRHLEGHYLNGGDLTERRKKEAALFFDGKWPDDLRANVYPVAKPTYSPAWGKVKRMDLTPYFEAAMKGSA